MIKFGKLIYDFFLHPMRIFFLYGGAFALIGVGVLLSEIDGYVSLHQFIFIELFCAAAFAGFLFTALPDWTHYDKSLLPYSIVGFILLSLAFIFIIFEFNARVIMVIFWLFLLFCTIYWLIRDKKYTHYSLVVILSSIAGIEIYSLFYVYKPYALIHCYSAAITVIGFRVSVVLAQLALEAKYTKESPYTFIPNPILKNISFIALLALVFCQMVDITPALNGFVALSAGLALLSKSGQWMHLVLLKKHYSLIYFLLLLGSGFIYTALGLNYIFEFTSISALLHGITIWVLMGFIFLIFNVASLRHSGQLVLNFPICGKIGFIFLAIAALSRGFLYQYSYSFYIVIPSIFVGLVFLIFVVRYFIIYKNNPFSNDPR